MFSLLIGCGPSKADFEATSTKIAANIFATQTAEAPTYTPTPTLTDIPTATPTPTPTPRPLSDAVLTLEDLPSGFIAETLRVDPGFSKGLIAPVLESRFAFSFETSDVFQLIAGQTELLTLRTERDDFDTMMGLLPYHLDAMAQTFSGKLFQDIEIEKEEIPNLDNIGETSNGWTAVIEGTPPFRMDIVYFRRDKVGSLIWSLYKDGETPVVFIGDAARKLDARIIDLLPQD